MKNTSQGNYEKYYGKKVPEDMPRSVAEFARSHGYHPSMSHVWIKKFSFPAQNYRGRWYLLSEEKAAAFLEWYKGTRQKSRWDEAPRTST